MARFRWSGGTASEVAMLGSAVTITEESRF
jgi:hypothetical protein